MRKVTCVSVLVFILVFMFSGIVSAKKSRNRGSSPQEILSMVEAGDLLHMREEEKLARDVYLELYEAHNYYRIFGKIAESEQRHMNALKVLVNKYGLDDPVGDDVRGEFKDDHLQAFYDDLVAQGLESLVGALTVGAIIEDLDIYDLQMAISRTDNEDIQTAYINLMKGSRNHLRAFFSELEAAGEMYIPEYICEGLFEEIVNSPKERGHYDIEDNEHLDFHTCDYENLPQD